MTVDGVVLIEINESAERSAEKDQTAYIHRLILLYTPG